jgi:hypothetical protein
MAAFFSVAGIRYFFLNVLRGAIEPPMRMMGLSPAIPGLLYM